jgi:hypothetical protein
MADAPLRSLEQVEKDVNACNSGTTLWNSGKEGKERRMTEHQQYCKT